MKIQKKSKKKWKKLWEVKRKIPEGNEKHTKVTKRNRQIELDKTNIRKRHQIIEKLTTIRQENVPFKEKKLNYLQKRLKRTRVNTIYGKS